MRPDWARAVVRLGLAASVLGEASASVSLPVLAQTAPPVAPHGAPTVPPPANSQVQVSRQFLGALLRGNYSAAYGQLAPEVRRSLSVTHFRQLAQPVAAQGKRRGPAVELYKIGMRLDEVGKGGQPFVAWAWAADSASERRVPPQWLEVRFRDAAARQVSGFSARRR